MPPPVSAPEQPGNLFTSVKAMRNRLRRAPRLLPDTFWTLTSNILNIISGILIFKLVSWYVPAAEYGKASLVLGIVGLLSQFIAGPTNMAHLRLYFEHAKEGRGGLYARAVSTLLLKTAATMAAIYLVIALAYFFA